MEKSRGGVGMIYRELGKTGLKISVFSFGAMRWRSEESCYEIMNRGMDLGMNYVDTSSGYVGGKSQVWTANAIKHRRSEIYFSNKSNWADAPDESKVRHTIEKQLRETGLEYFDFYQLWGLGNMETLKKALAKGGTVEGIRKAMDEGLVRYGPGFTFHGPDEVFKAAVDSGEFLCATISYNIMSRKQENLIDYAHQKGVGLFVMNPLAGGVLAMADGKEFEFLKGPGCGSCYGALRFLVANRGITTCLLGLTDIEHLEENMKALEGAEDLDEAYRIELGAKMAEVQYTKGNFCTGCGYCRVCPNGFDPSHFMQAMRDYTIYGVRSENLENWLYSKYVHRQTPRQELAKCKECGLCEEKCPQKLKIVDQIREVKAALAV